MPDRPDDSHLAPLGEPGTIIDAPAGVRSVLRTAAAAGRFVRLCERQGTRLVDLFERYVESQERLADVQEHAAGIPGQREKND